ncbi:ATP-binding protein [Streptomyces verrucosisporus]|uniref:ATP-binding protein n=1 Tax=Streptomyces verrucosisporus TaxID=1695161 RepID=UPI0019CFD5D7|nr:ATP-binding protein [Streptomyces verrucosisporus]MBN3931816.1 ATP-binding protein [Streptomyces verrucosisporus]
MGTEGPTVLDRLWHDFPSLDPDALSGSASCALQPRYEAVKTAREFTRNVLLRWRLAGHFDTVALVVSELVTNALRHGVPGAVPGEILDPPVRLHLMHWSGRLVCAVRDPSAKAPVAKRPGEGFTVELGGIGCDFGDELDGEFDGGFGGGFFDDTAESGRGLFLVESFSDDWGWQPMAGAMPGKVVWALFRVNPGRETGVSPV